MTSRLILKYNLSMHCIVIQPFNPQTPENWLTDLMHWNRKHQKTGSVSHAFKQTTVDQRALKLQYCTYHYYTCHKILVLVV